MQETQAACKGKFYQNEENNESCSTMLSKIDQVSAYCTSFFFPQINTLHRVFKIYLLRT